MAELSSEFSSMKTTLAHIFNIKLTLENKIRKYISQAEGHLKSHNINIVQQIINIFYTIEKVLS